MVAPVTRTAWNKTQRGTGVRQKGTRCPKAAAATYPNHLLAGPWHVVDAARQQQRSAAQTSRAAESKQSRQTQAAPATAASSPTASLEEIPPHALHDAQRRRHDGLLLVAKVQLQRHGNRDTRTGTPPERVTHPHKGGGGHADPPLQQTDGCTGMDR